MKEKLITEGWRYINLCGKYKNKTHDSSYHDFCQRIEELKMSQLDKELKELKTDEDNDDPDINLRTPVRNEDGLNNIQNESSRARDSEV